MIRFAVCDDVQAETGHLEEMIIAQKPLYDQEFDIAVFFSGEEFCESLNKTNEIFDIVLMDIQMKGITGVEAGKKASRKNSQRSNFTHFCFRL